MSDELNAVKTDVALIKKDVKQIERFFDKVDSVMSEMSDMTKSLAVQQKIMEHFASKLDDLEETMEEHKQEDIKRTEILHKRLEEHRQSSKEDHKRLSDESAKNRAERNAEIMAHLDKLHGNLESRMIGLKSAADDQETRLREIERLKWWLIGAIGVITFLSQFANNINLGAFIS